MTHTFTLAFLQGQELWIVLLVILVLFGGKKIPELMRGVGKGVGELQKGLDEGKRSVDYSAKSEPADPASKTDDDSK
ncbi:MAG: twin-arginine translocase TatA/TatE family subunit [Fimbriimonadaceae bacterium]|nr:twin-arginine translocase TatA/TatE family subunit [Fimbriimonadaceae bacterium]QOJ12671.1 MAG: twin-arginine translocase TatA/TatE family subunit [Chthonomonadaceae bacterium]